MSKFVSINESIKLSVVKTSLETMKEIMLKKNRHPALYDMKNIS